MTSQPRTEANQLLASLPPEDYDRLLPWLELVPLAYRKVLQNPYQPIEYVYFPHEGMYSQVTIMEDGGALETGVIGREGMVGVQVFLSSGLASNQSMVQIPGQALRLRGEELRASAEQSPALRARLQRYVLSLWNQTAQAAACNRLHPVEERCARWLLTAHDRAGTDSLPLTQEFLSIMLGVRRATVTTVLAILQKAGFIRGLRGRIDVVDRAGLEGASCECYAVMRREAESVFA